MAEGRVELMKKKNDEMVIILQEDKEGGEGGGWKRQRMMEGRLKELKKGKGTKKKKDREKGRNG